MHRVAWPAMTGTQTSTGPTPCFCWVRPMPLMSARPGLPRGAATGWVAYLRSCPGPLCPLSSVRAILALWPP